MKIDKSFFKTLKMKVMDGDYSIIKSKIFYPNAFANIKASDFYTVIIDQDELIKKDTISSREEFLAIEKSFKIIQFETIIPINLIGFIAEIANALAKQNISILIVSSYSTDHIIIRKKDLSKTIKTLKSLGIQG